MSTTPAPIDTVVIGRNTFAHLTTDGQVKGAPGVIHTITVAPTQSLPVAGVVTVYDSLTEGGTVVLSIYVPAAVVPYTLTLNIACATGIYVGFDASLTGVNVVTSYV